MKDTGTGSLFFFVSYYYILSAGQRRRFRIQDPNDHRWHRDRIYTTYDIMNIIVMNE